MLADVLARKGANAVGSGLHVIPLALLCALQGMACFRSMCGRVRMFCRAGIRSFCRNIMCMCGSTYDIGRVMPPWSLLRCCTYLR